MIDFDVGCVVVALFAPKVIFIALFPFLVKLVNETNLIARCMK